MTTEQVRYLIDRCAEDNEELGPKAQSAAYCTGKQTTWCLHEEFYSAFKRVIDPLIAGFGKRWVKRGRSRFLLFVAPSWSEDGVFYERMKSITARARRAARVRKAAGHHLKEHYRILWEIQDGRCYFSGEPLGQNFEDRKYSVDHLYPLASGRFMCFLPAGTQWPVNLALVTPFVNSGKGGRKPGEYLSEVRKFKTFIPRPTKERRKIDRLRFKLFADFMREHCSYDEGEWGPRW